MSETTAVALERLKDAMLANDKAWSRWLGVSETGTAVRSAVPAGENVPGWLSDALEAAEKTAWNASETASKAQIDAGVAYARACAAAQTAAAR